ncbi:MAG: 3-mercaptopyruvate sulfurtransferase [Pseudomonadota bacterium]
MSELPSVVSTQWLHAHLDEPQMRVVDASWYLPGEQRDPAHEYLQQHIPGAVFFDIDAICDTTSVLPHMAPTAHQFARDVGALGIGDGDTVVVYDTAGLFSAARVWWLFRLMGIETVAVLDGGLPKWLAEARPVETGETSLVSRTLRVTLDRSRVRTLDEVQCALPDPKIQIVDARPPARFLAEAPEPRPELPSGHMPGARCVFFKSVLNPDGTMLDVDALRAVFAAAGVDVSQPVITSCGSGVTAAVLSLALDCMGHRDHALYDGAWSEWAATLGCEVVTGAG